MNTEEKGSGKKRIILIVAVYLTLFLAIVTVANLKQINQWLGSVLMLLRPVLFGLALAYICNPLFHLLERKVFRRLRPQGLRRAVSLALTYVVALSVILLILFLIVPQLIDSILTFAGNYNAHISSAIAQINQIFESINGLFERVTGNEELLWYLDEAELRKNAAELFSDLDKTSQMLMSYLSGIDLKTVISTFSGALSVLTDSIFGIFVSIYLLSTKEKRAAQVMKLRRALFSDRFNERLTKLIKTADRSFGGFIEGKLLDSLLIGILLYISFLIFRIPYALLIAAFIAIANIIPIVGAIIGAVPSALILLLSAPGKVIPFLLIVLIVQQIDNNIISPKILGSNTGISSLCVMIAITTMGSLWGFVGMLLGVPLFATVLELTDIFVTGRLQRKGLPSGLANYYANDAIVDPTQNAHATADKTVQSFEKKALRLRKLQESGEKLNRKQKLTLTIYRLAHKYHILTDMTDETHARFAAEQAAKDAAAEAELLLLSKREAKSAPAVDSIDATNQ